MGVEIVTTVLTAAPTYDLTDLSTAKSELSIPQAQTGDNAFILRGISQVSAAAANYCNRVFPVETLSDLTYLYRNSLQRDVSPALQLSRWPVLSIASVIEDAGLESATTLVAGTDYQLRAENGQLLRLNAEGSLRPWSGRTVTVQYSAGFGNIAAQAATIPTTPFQVKVTNAAKFAIDLGVIGPANAVFVPVASSPATGQYAVSAAGLYTFAAADAGKAVTISYGYTAIPLDLVDAVLRMVTMRFKAKGRDPMQMSLAQPGIGEQRFWVGTVPGQTSAFPPEIEGILDNYCLPTIG